MGETNNFVHETDTELVAALRHLSVKVAGLTCSGCGREHNCGIAGCRILREAADAIENMGRAIFAQANIISKQAGSNIRISQLALELDSVKAERDGVLEDLKTLVSCCDVCGHMNLYASDEVCDVECEMCDTPCACHDFDKENSNFVWRGLRRRSHDG